MRTFGTGGRLADVEARIGAEMRAASAEGWRFTNEDSTGDAKARTCCALGAVVRDLISTMQPLIPVTLVRLQITDSEYSAIASGFDGEVFDPDTNEWVAMGRRLRVLGDELNRTRGAA